MLTEKRCPVCKHTKPISGWNKHTNARDGLQYQCKECLAKYRRGSKDRIRAYNKRKYAENRLHHLEVGKRYYEAHREERVAYHKRHNAENSAAISARRYIEKRDVLAAYGGACECCGESDIRFLNIDHINGKSSEQAKREGGTSTNLYRYLRKNGHPKDGYRVLCFNCNCGRELNGGICPHKTKVVYNKKKEALDV